MGERSVREQRRAQGKEEGTRFPPGVDFLAKPFGQNDFVIKIHDIFENQKIKQSKSLTYKRI